MDEGCYAECLVRRRMTPAAIAGMIGMILLLIAGLMILFVFPGTWSVLPLIAAILVVFIAYRFLRVEYEYIFVMGELQIDRIYSGSVRKKGPRIDMSNIETVEKADENRIAHQKRQNPKTVSDYTSHLKGGDPYMIVYRDQEGSKLLLFEPDENLLKTMRRTSPSKVKLPTT